MATCRDPARSVLRRSTEVTDSPCTICQTREIREVESTNYCVDCDSNMCGACTRSHAMFLDKAPHQVVDISRAPGNIAKPVPLPKQRCDEHGRQLDRYCEDHDVIACETCVNMTHRNCIQLKYVPKIAKGISKTDRFEVVKSSLEELLKALKQRQSLQRDTLHQLEKAEVQSKQEVKDLTDMLHMYIDELLKSDTAKIISKYQQKRGAVQRDMAMINDQIDTTETINKRLVDFVPGENESELFVYIMQGEKKETGAKQVMDTVCRANIAIPTYKVNSTIEMSLKDITSLGEFKKTVLKLNKEVNVRTTSDTMSCNITGICILPDASLILADYNNESLKHLDSSYGIISCLDLSTEPSDVCPINNDEVAVALDGEIQFVRVGATMKKTQSFSVNIYAGICFSDNELFVCCRDVDDLSRHYVGVYSLSGSTLRTLQYDQAGQPLFTELSNITISSCGRKLHINDRKGVITIDRNGNLLSTYTDPELDYPDGICTLENGDLIVSGFESNNVLHISKDDMKLGVVLKKEDGIVGPQALCYDSVKSRLIVCLYWKTIMVYDVHEQ